MMTEPILIVEDDLNLSQILQEILEFEGIKSSIIADGALALKRLAQVAPPLIILDMHLPNVSGLEIITYIRSRPDLSGVKICVITADPQMAASARKDADKVYVKPLSLDEIDEILALLR
jgi:DNA-binding response OmpR family regulator